MYRRAIGIDHLTALSLDPATFIEVAGRTGFASVSLRTIHIAGGEPLWHEMPVNVHRIRRATEELGTKVHAIEAVAINADLAGNERCLLPQLEQGAAMGAALLYGFIDDEDLARATDTLGALAHLAREVGLHTLIEPMPYRSVATLAQASKISSNAGAAGVIVDTLHASRGGTSPAALKDLNQSQLQVIQLCDAPAVAPTAAPTSGLHPLLHEARFDRKLPGAGDLPLAEFVRAMPAEALVTVEAPIPGIADPRRFETVLAAARLVVDGAPQ